jgi:hypothetical protein
MVRIYDNREFEERLLAGEFELRREVTMMKRPWRDHKEQLLVANVNRYLLDRRYPDKHRRRIACHTHNFETDTGEIGASGKAEPKELLDGDIEYRQLAFENPQCYLCVNGDMIPIEERFLSSKYKPQARCRPSPD